MRKLFWGGVHPEGHKALSRGAAPVPAPLPAQVVLPMVQHIGAACTPVVQVGDEVKLGQKIGDGEGICAPIHASVSGKVVAVEPRPHPGGSDVLSVVIENDYTDTPDDTLKPHLTHQELSSEEILRIIRDAGIVGMGGAAFPTDVKAFSALGHLLTLLAQVLDLLGAQAGLQAAAQDGDGRGHRAVVPDDLLHLQSGLYVLGIGHAVGDDGGLQSHHRLTGRNSSGYFRGYIQKLVQIHHRYLHMKSLCQRFFISSGPGAAVRSWPG